MVAVRASVVDDHKWNAILAASAVFFAVCLAVALVAAGRPSGAFVAPSFDDMARSGQVPELDEALGWTVLADDDLPFMAGVCGRPRATEQGLEVYFANLAENEDWLMLRAVDGEGNVLGSTGLVRPGEHIRFLQGNFQGRPEVGLRVMAYKPNLYYSDGSVVLWTTVQA